MGFSEAVAWWDEWQVRVLALASLFLQCFLYIAAPLRGRGIVPPSVRFLIWLAYMGSDAAAIYALAALFNHQRKLEWVSAHRSSASLQALWAPILLLHLGGQDSIAAYNLEDNELWKRHVLTALSQITIAIYVFRKTMSGADKRLFQATMVMFVPGILKCLEKPWALYRASINSMADNLGSRVQLQETTTPGVSSLRGYVEAAARYVESHSPKEEGEPSSSPSGHASKDGKKKETGPEVNGEPYKLFVDLSYSYQRRLQDLEGMVGTRDKAHTLVRDALSKTFGRLYTKLQVYGGTRRGCLTRIAVTYLPCAAIGLFHNCRREDYDRTDVRVTYVLLCGTIAAPALELVLFILGMFCCCGILGLLACVLCGCCDTLLLGRRGTGACCACCATQQEGRRRRRPATEREPPKPTQKVGQYNLIGYMVARNQKRTRTLASLLRCACTDQQLGRTVLTTAPPCESSEGITRLVHEYLTDGWKSIKDVEKYRGFNDNRGDWTLRNKLRSTSLGWSLRKPFDESVLLWHLATDLCFYHEDAGPDDQGQAAVAGHCRVISNYMAYLLFVKPEMLVPGARHGLFTAGYDRLQYGMREWNHQQRPGEADLKERKATSQEAQRRELAANIIRMLEGVEEDHYTRPIHEARRLACQLMGRGEEQEEKPGEERKREMWEVIQGVWVEMLCFSAGRCRGYLHAKSLGNGGEYLSYVWLLMSYMGMETLAERLRRTKPDQEEEGDIDADVPALPPGSSSAATTGPSAPAPGSSEPATAVSNAAENV